MTIVFWTKKKEASLVKGKPGACLLLSTSGSDGLFSPTTALLFSVQVEEGRWENTNEWTNPGPSSLPTHMV